MIALRASDAHSPRLLLVFVRLFFVLREPLHHRVTRNLASYSTCIFAPFRKTWCRSILIFGVFTPSLQLRSMFSRPPAEMIPVVNPRLLILCIHSDQEFVGGGSDRQGIYTLLLFRLFCLLSREPCNHLRHQRFTALINCRFPTNCLIRDNLLSVPVLSVELRPCLKPEGARVAGQSEG